MDLAYIEMEIANGGDVYLQRRNLIPSDEVRRVLLDVLVDTSAYMLSINETVRVQLDLPLIEKQLGRLADDTPMEVDIVGPLEVRFEGRETVCNAVVLPGEADVVLGRRLYNSLIDPPPFISLKSLNYAKPSGSYHVDDLGNRSVHPECLHT